MSYELDEVKEAARWLATSPRAPQAYDDLDTLLRTVPKLPVKLTGDSAVLNPLLYAAKENPELFETVVQWAASKRELAGLPPFRREAGGFDKTEYMREFMQAKRVRERRAVEIENMLRSDHDRLKGRTRMDFLQVTSRKWKAERDQMLADARNRFGGTMSKDQVQAVLAKFWETLDKRLDELEAANARKLRGG